MSCASEDAPAAAADHGLLSPLPSLTRSEKRLAMRVAGALWTVGGATIVAVGLLAYADPVVHRVVLAVGGGALAWGCLCLVLLRGERVADWVWHTPAVSGVVASTYASLVVGAGSPFRFYPLFILLYCSFFFPWHQARRYFPLATFGYLLATLGPTIDPLRELAAVDAAGAGRRALLGEAFVLVPMFWTWSLLAARARESARRWRDRERRRALTDQLTGLANRRALLAHLETELARSDGAGTGLVIVDLDGFKQFNTNFGYLVGDRVIVAVARRLRRVVRDQDLLVRLGGDEFAIVVGEADASGVDQVAQRAVAAVPCSAGELGLSEASDQPLGASAGAAIAPRDGATVDELIAAADARLRAAKENGKGIALGVGLARTDASLARP